jgi:ketosteroid isomerase-like protein
MKDATSLPDALSRDMWKPLRDNVAQLQVTGDSIERRLARLEAESYIRDLLVKYCYSYDSNDIEGVMATFSHDCVLVNPRATFAGAEAIQRNYEHLFTTRRYSFHHVTNVTMRFNEALNEASVTSYWSDKHVGKSGSIDGSDGTYTDRMKKFGNEWKITERRITANIFYVMTPYPDPWPPLPEPTKKEGTRDWFGTTYMR